MIRISKTIPASRLHLQSWLPRAYRRDRWPLSSRLVAPTKSEANRRSANAAARGCAELNEKQLWDLRRNYTLSIAAKCTPMGYLGQAVVLSAWGNRARVPAASSSGEIIGTQEGLQCVFRSSETDPGGSPVPGLKWCGGRLATPWLYGSSRPYSSRALEPRSGPFVVAAVDVSVEHAD